MAKRSFAVMGLGVPVLAWAQPSTAAASAINGGDTAWMLICTVLVLMMTMPGIILFYGGMLRTKNALSVVAHTIAAATVVTLAWAIVGYTLAFSAGNGFFGGFSKLFAAGLLGTKAGVHPAAPTVPEAAFFMFQLAFAVVTFAIILGATAERVRMVVPMRRTLGSHLDVARFMRDGHYADSVLADALASNDQRLRDYAAYLHKRLAGARIAASPPPLAPPAIDATPAPPAAPAPPHPETEEELRAKVMRKYTTGLR